MKILPPTRILAIASLSILTLLGGGCATGRLQVKSVVDESRDFAAYQTFSWKQDSLNRIASVDTDGRDIQRSVEAELTRRGLSQVENGGDLTVVVLAGGTTEALGGRYEIGAGSYDAWYNYYSAPIYANTEFYARGHLIIDLVDRESGTLAWRGYATGIVSDPQRLERRIPELIARVFKEFPVQPE